MDTPSPDPSTAASAPSPDSTPGQPDGAPVVRAIDVADGSRRRRAPRYGRFGFLGFVVGVLVAVVLALLPIGDSGVGRGDLFIVLVLGLATVGVFAGLTVAYLLDRRSLRRHAAD